MISTTTAAIILGVTPRRVQVLCQQRRIPGARRHFRGWLLPDEPTVTPGMRGPKRK